MKIGVLGKGVFSTTILLSVVLLLVRCSADDPANPPDECATCDDGEQCVTGVCQCGGGTCSDLEHCETVSEDGSFECRCGNQASCGDPLTCIMGGSGLRCGCDTSAHCDDGVGCTDDACTDGDCSSTPNDSNCDNGLFCDGAETCHADNDCLDGAPPVMDDAIACTEDFCDEETDRLINAALKLSDARIVDALEDVRLESVFVDQQVLVAADLENLCDEVDFAFVVDIRDPAGDVTNTFITGSLAPGQAFSPALSWIPLIPGRHEVLVSVGESPGAPPMRRAPVIFIEAE